MADEDSESEIAAMIRARYEAERVSADAAKAAVEQHSKLKKEQGVDRPNLLEQVFGTSLYKQIMESPNESEKPKPFGGGVGYRPTKPFGQR